MKWKSVLKIVRDSKNIKKPRLVDECLEMFNPSKFLVEPAEHKKFDTGVKIELPKDYVGYLSIKINVQDISAQISQNITIDWCKKKMDEKRLILNFLNTSFAKTYSIEMKNNLIGLLAII